MVELVTAGEPDVVCLQELPVWALARLAGWSGMEAATAVARRPLLRAGAKLVTDLHHGLLRSALTGEGAAILTRVRADDLGATCVSSAGLRRIVQRVRLEDGTVVANVHVSGVAAQWERVGELVEGEQRAIVAGDANIPGAALAGFSAPLPGSIDQILVRGLPASTPSAWPEERRRRGDRLLSDHAPVELRTG